MTSTPKRQRRPLTDPGRDVQAADLLLDNWEDLLDAPADDLVFECSLDAGTTHSKVSVFTDRVVVSTPASDTPTVHELEQITSWNVRSEDDDTSSVEVNGPKRSRTRLPRAFSAALTVALQETLHDFPAPKTAHPG
jgi:hypothetical protein